MPSAGVDNRQAVRIGSAQGVDPPDTELVRNRQIGVVVVVLLAAGSGATRCAIFFGARRWTSFFPSRDIRGYLPLICTEVGRKMCCSRDVLAATMRWAPKIRLEATTGGGSITPGAFCLHGYAATLCDGFCVLIIRCASQAPSTASEHAAAGGAATSARSTKVCAGAVGARPGAGRCGRAPAPNYRTAMEG